MKRIPCKVVRSVPFQRDDDKLRQCGCEGMRFGDSGVEFLQAGFEPLLDSYGCMFRSNAVKAPFGQSVSGLLLDCLA